MMADKAEMLSDEAVAEYLAANPDFFLNHEALLDGLHIPHNAGGASSLLERQIQVLRTKDAEHERKLAQIIDAARANELQVTRQHQLILALLHTESLQESVEVLHDQLKEDFGVDFAQTIFFAEADSKLANAGVRCALPDELRDAGMAAFFDSYKAIFGRLSGDFKGQLFGDDADNIGSLGIVPINGENPVGVLVLAARDTERFTPAMGGELLERLGQLIGGVFSLRAQSL